MLLKVRFGQVQNGHRTVIFDYGLTHLLNEPARLQVIVYANMNQHGIVYK